MRLQSKFSRFELLEAEIQDTQIKTFQEESNRATLELREARSSYQMRLEQLEAEEFERRMNQREEMELSLAKANHIVADARHDLEIQRIKTREAASKHEARLEHFVASSREEFSRRDREHEASIAGGEGEDTEVATRAKRGRRP